MPKFVALPEGVREEEVTTHGNARIVSPRGQRWDAGFGAPGVSDDFTADREQQRSRASRCAWRSCRLMTKRRSLRPDPRSMGSPGEIIGPYDLMIAGHARSQGLVVVTDNQEEFDRVPGLQVENWVKTASG